jgi:cell division protein FtsW (lipid II flippase)
MHLEHFSIGTQLYIGNSSHCKYGCKCKHSASYRVTLPLVSMGGSSFLFTCAAIGIILSVARNVEQLEGKEPLLEPLITVKENKVSVVKTI